MGDWGMRVSKEGFDVKTCADEDLIMSSSFNMLKTKVIGTTAGSIAHGLAYVPAFMANEQFGTTAGFVGQVLNGPVFMDSTYFYANASGTVHYYIFYQQSV